MAATDLHAFWDSRCAECHRHAGAFARDHFTVRDGKLIGRNPTRDICAFLQEHGAGPEMAGPVCAMLTAQAATPSLFKSKCASCHGPAAGFARSSLVAGEAGTLKGKDNGRDIADFLVTHGDVSAAERGQLVETLKRVHQEVQ